MPSKQTDCLFSLNISSIGSKHMVYSAELDIIFFVMATPFAQKGVAIYPKWLYHPV